MKDLFELKLEIMMMEEYENKSLKLLRYVGFMKDENLKIWIFLSGFPLLYMDKI
jgi:hypothetical protein